MRVSPFVVAQWGDESPRVVLEKLSSSCVLQEQLVDLGPTIVPIVILVILKVNFCMRRRVCGVSWVCVSEWQ